MYGILRIIFLSPNYPGVSGGKALTSWYSLHNLTFIAGHKLQRQNQSEVFRHSPYDKVKGADKINFNTPVTGIR